MNPHADKISVQQFLLKNFQQVRGRLPLYSHQNGCISEEGRQRLCCAYATIPPQTDSAESASIHTQWKLLVEGSLPMETHLRLS